LNDVRKNTDREVTFNNFQPQVTFNFTPKQQRRFNFNYNGSTTNPTLSQIQPVIDNIDPLNITVGNPNLKQAFNHRLSFRGSDYKVLKNRSWSFSVNYSSTDNAITNSSFVDSLGRRISQAINVSGNYNYNIQAGYGFDIVPSLNVSLNVGPGNSRYVSVINGKNNVTDNKTWEIFMYGGYWSDKWINFWMNGTATYNQSVSSIRPDVTTNYWQYGFYSNVQLKFKKQKTYVDLGLQATIYQKTAAFANQQNSFIFSPTIRKVISKDDNWEIKLIVNDLFNQNIGVTRSISSNFISETSTETIKRFVMLSLIYNFSKNGKPSNNGF
jgi:hypothetical protein